jgi:hypothetical protein
LKEHSKADEVIDLHNPITVDTSISRPTRNGYLLKPRFSQEPLTESLEPRRRKRAKKTQKGLSMVRRTSCGCSLLICRVFLGCLCCFAFLGEPLVDILEQNDRGCIRQGGGAALLREAPDSSTGRI